jgi:hypothetical protein
MSKQRVNEIVKQASRITATISSPSDNYTFMEILQELLENEFYG